MVLAACGLSKMQMDQEVQINQNRKTLMQKWKDPTIQKDKLTVEDNVKM